MNDKHGTLDGFGKCKNPKKIRVIWGCRLAVPAVLPDHPGEEIRTMTRDFGTRAQAAEFAEDILFMIDPQGKHTASTETAWKLRADKPRVEWMSNTRDQWVIVSYWSHL